MTLPKRLVSLLLIYCFVITVAPHTRAADPSSSKPSATEESTKSRSAFSRVYDFLSTVFSSGSKPASDDEESDKEAGLRFHLSEAPGQPEARSVNKVAAATVLSDAETEEILRRLPSIKTEPTDEATFALREKSPPPPRTGATIMQSFPAPNEIAPPDQKATGPLEVVRYSPEGDVPIAPNLSVTFSQPMVAVTSQEEVAENVPVKLSPQPPGKWHWIGTKTLLFEPEVRFPMATQYSVTVPAGVKSAYGGAIANAKTWTFTTPPPTVKNFYPTRASVQRRDVLMFAEFDQRIDPGAVLRNIRVEAGNDRIPARLATPEEIEKDKEVRQLAPHAEKDRWLAFWAIDTSGKTENVLPGGANIDVSILAGTPSAEGPLVTKEAQNFPFMTFGPLRVTKAQCGNVNTRVCTPYDQWQIEFSNQLKADGFEESQVRVEPAIERMKASVSWNGLTIEGTRKPSTTYRVTLDKSLHDQFDQTLGKDETVEFKVGPMQPRIALSGQGLVVLDPAGPRQLSLYSVNYQTVRVSLYAVEPEDWIKFQVYRQLHYRGPTQVIARNATLPGRLVFSKQIDLKQVSNEMIETTIDLTPALNDGFGQAIVAVESITPASDNYHSPLLA